MDFTSVRELVIVDGSLRESAHFTQPPRPETRIEFLDQNRDGVRQITDLLQQYRQLDAIQIYSHGASGQLRLGSGTLSNDTIGTYADDLSAWGSSLTLTGDILLFGCDVALGTGGTDFVRALTGLTQADVAASINPTGPASLGGDWNLEFDTGTIEAAPGLSASSLGSFSGLLGLQLTIDAAPNFIVDSNLKAGPTSAYLSVKVTNTGATALNDVFVNMGNFAANTPGIYPVKTNPTVGGTTYSGSLSLTHEGGAADAVRYIGDLAAGASTTQYWLVSYPYYDKSATPKPLFGAQADPSDDMKLDYDV